MEEINRLTQAGMDPECAARVAHWYASMCDGEGLEDFILAVEAGYEFCRIQRKSER